MGITPTIRMLCFVLINSVLLNLLCVWILFQAASRHSCFRFFFLVQNASSQLVFSFSFCNVIKRGRSSVDYYVVSRAIRLLPDKFKRGLSAADRCMQGRCDLSG